MSGEEKKGKPFAEVLKEVVKTCGESRRLDGAVAQMICDALRFDPAMESRDYDAVIEAIDESSGELLSSGFVHTFLAQIRRRVLTGKAEAEKRATEKATQDLTGQVTDAEKLALLEAKLLLATKVSKRTKAIVGPLTLGREVSTALASCYFAAEGIGEATTIDQLKKLAETFEWLK